MAASATSRLLGVLVNLVVCRPSSLAQLQHLGALDVVLPLLDAKAYSSEGTWGELTGSCWSWGPDLEAIAWDLQTRLQLRRFAQEILQRICDFIRKVAAIDGQILEVFDPPVRLVVTLLTKTGALKRLADKEATALSTLVRQLSPLLLALQPSRHVAKEDQGSSASRLRGNLALLFGQLSEMQSAADGEKSSAMQALDFSELVEPLLEMFRRERGPAQHNLGVCITKLMSNSRYRDLVKDFNGLESLHQIQLPKVNGQKAGGGVSCFLDDHPTAGNWLATMVSSPIYQGYNLLIEQLLTMVTQWGDHPSWGGTGGIGAPRIFFEQFFSRFFFGGKLFGEGQEGLVHQGSWMVFFGCS
eukprot:Skav234285  [mRNA]  locus=scaffold2271:33096:38469:+ [translate_table: standard]